jgi:hypothetical protein
MRNTGFTAVAAAMILMGFGISVGAWTTARALSADLVTDSAFCRPGD